MVLWMIADRMGCGVYRCLIPALGLKDNQITDSEFAERRQISPQEGGRLATEILDGVSLVIMQRPGHPLFRQWMLEIKRRRLPVFVELDDDIWHIAKHNPAHTYWHTRRVRNTFEAMLRQADKILVSTPALAAQVRAFTGRHQDDIVVTYNHLNTAVWGQELLDTMPIKPDPLGRTVIGWQGSPTHGHDFRVVVEALKQVLAEYPNTILRLFGSVPDCVRGVIPPARFEWAKGVPFENYPLMLRGMQFDIMLAPLAPTVFNESKSNIRWLEASALQIPTIASNVGPYRAIVHGETGLVADTHSDWVSHLRVLVEDVDLRQRLAARAHECVWREWGHDRVQSWANATGVLWPTAAVATAS